MTQLIFIFATQKNFAMCFFSAGKRVRAQRGEEGDYWLLLQATSTQLEFERCFNSRLHLQFEDL